jgi:hypothetical protein
MFINEEQKKTYKASYLFRRSDRAMLRRFVMDDMDTGTGLLLILRVFRRQHYSATSYQQYDSVVKQHA